MITRSKEKTESWLLELRHQNLCNKVSRKILLFPNCFQRWSTSGFLCGNNFFKKEHFAHLIIFVCTKWKKPSGIVIHDITCFFLSFSKNCHLLEGFSFLISVLDYMESWGPKTSQCIPLSIQSTLVCSSVLFIRCQGIKTVYEHHDSRLCPRTRQWSCGYFFSAWLQEYAVKYVVSDISFAYLQQQLYLFLFTMKVIKLYLG